MTATDQRTKDLFPCQTLSSVSSHVGSVTDFFSTSLHCSSPSDEEQHLNETPTELNTSGNPEKLGHRRVDETGNVTYKRFMVDDLMKSLQIGLRHFIGQDHQPQRPVLLQDFEEVEYQDFPPDGSKSTPKHEFAEFRLKTYAQIAFRFFRNAFGVDPSSFMISLCAKDLRELPNAGASGSIFYLTADDTYIIKTVSRKEAQFLRSLLPGYYMNLTQNPMTLLPKFFGMFRYQSANKNIRFVIMNNLVPTRVRLHEKYDLKGSIYKRKASEEERKREMPTLKDNDFKHLHPSGLELEPFFHDQLMQTIKDDTRVLSSFGIMDYSLLLVVHNITEEIQSTRRLSLLPPIPLTASLLPIAPNRSPSSSIHDELTTASNDSGIAMTTISNLPTYIQYFRVIEFIRAQQEPSILDEQRPQLSESIETQASTQPMKLDSAPPENALQTTDERSSRSINGLIGGDAWYNRQNLSRLAMAGIPATNKNGDLLLLYLGIIDILQSYRLRKQLEHALKSTLVTREEISVCNPTHYGDRFVRFLSRKVFHRGSHVNVIPSDGRSTIDQVTVYSSRLVDPSASWHSQTSDGSSMINRAPDRC